MSEWVSVEEELPPDVKVLWWAEDAGYRIARADRVDLRAGQPYWPYTHWKLLTPPEQEERP